MCEQGIKDFHRGNKKCAVLTGQKMEAPASHSSRTHEQQLLELINKSKNKEEAIETAITTIFYALKHFQSSQ